MFCQGDLGKNEAVESFPIGRRLAFDSAKGRLWVVCRKCERWNLTPMEERWEAIEACERWFRETRTRVSTDQVGLARLREGLELVRIGAPQRPEFAAWRYGDQFGRRRQKHMLMAGGVAGVVGVGVIAGLATGAVSAIALGQTGNFYNLVVQNRTVARIRLPDQRVIKISHQQLEGARFSAPPSPDEKWHMVVEHKKGVDEFTGQEAVQLAGKLVTRANRGGGNRKQVRAAVDEIEAARHPEAFLDQFLATHAVEEALPRYPLIGITGKPLSREKQLRRKGQKVKGSFAAMDKPTRLALEMALHEEQERRAMEGELAILEEAWRQAEEIAAIADNLLVSPETEAFIRDHREAG